MTNQKKGKSIGRPKIEEGTEPTNELILHAATELFLKNGYQKVSVDEIAKVAGMTKAMVYYYFGSKAELFKTTMVALMGRIQKQIVRLLTSDKPLYDRLFDVTIAHLRATTTFDMEGYMRESRTSLTNDQVQEIKLAEENMYFSIEQAFLNAIKNEEIPAIHPKFAAHSYIALVKVGNYKQSDGTPFFATVEETADQILNVFWRGFIGD